MSGRVYSYLRFSDPRQAAGSSADRQAAYAAKWAAEHGLVLDESLSLKDEGLSAYHQRHVKSGALGVFLQAVESGMISQGSVLVVEGLDRLSRAEPIQAQAQLAQIVNAGITVVTASDGKTYSRATLKANPMDLVYSLLVMIRAHEESDTKSKRVTAAIRKQCEGWVAGTFRGIIRNGKDPAWLRLVDPSTPGAGKWELIPERVAAVRKGIELYSMGYGAGKIVEELTRLDLRMTDRGPSALQIYRVIKQRVLLGEKELQVGGETYRLAGYYPPILTEVEWDDLQAMGSKRTRQKVRGELPHVVSGLGILHCGYCGGAMVGQNMLQRSRLPDGRVRDSHRRLRCVANFHGDGCRGGGGSCSSGPVERALMAYCSDMMNLRALLGGDRATEPRARLVKARAALADVTTKLERLMAVILADDSGAVPASFAAKARELEQLQGTTQAQIEEAERDLAGAARISLKGADEIWRTLAAGVEAQDYDARMRARQLVGETFERIVLYWKGLRPRSTPRGHMDLILIAKGGVSRALRITPDGKWTSAEDVTLAA